MKRCVIFALVSCFQLVISQGIRGEIQTLPPVSSLNEVSPVSVGSQITLRDNLGVELVAEMSSNGDVFTYRTFYAEFNDTIPLSLDTGLLVYSKTEFAMRGPGEYYYIDANSDTIDGDDFGGMRDTDLLNALRDSPGYGEYLDRFIQAQFLYQEFFIGRLTGYDYDNASGRAGSNDAIQKSLWGLEGWGNFNVDAYPIPDLTSASRTDLGDFLILNMLTADDEPREHTDIFGVGPRANLVPEPGTFALCLLAMCLTIARRRSA